MSRLLAIGSASKGQSHIRSDVYANHRVSMDSEEMKMGKPVKDESERRLKLVSLAYEVLRDMKTPDEATDEEMLSLLSRAFFDKATALMELAPPCMYYTADNARTVALRRSVH